MERKSKQNKSPFQLRKATSLADVGKNTPLKFEAKRSGMDVGTTYYIDPKTGQSKETSDLRVGRFGGSERTRMKTDKTERYDKQLSHYTKVPLMGTIGGYDAETDKVYGWGIRNWG